MIGEERGWWDDERGIEKEEEELWRNEVEGLVEELKKRRRSHSMHATDPWKQHEVYSFIHSFAFSILLRSTTGRRGGGGRGSIDVA